MCRAWTCVCVCVFRGNLSEAIILRLIFGSFTSIQHLRSYQDRMRDEDIRSRGWFESVDGVEDR